MHLTSKIKQQLKAQAHSLRPIVLIGNKGLTVAVIKEIDRALLDHELIKLRLQGENKAASKKLLNEIAQQINATPLQVIGHIGVLYRPNKKPVL